MAGLPRWPRTTAEAPGRGRAPRNPGLAWALACLGLGALSVAGFAPLSWWPLVPLSLAGLFLAWRTAPISRLACGFWYGLGLFAVGVHWIYISLHEHGAMPAALAALALLGFAAFNAGIPALAGALSELLARRGRCPPGPDLLLIMPGAWTLLEWVRLWLFTGFPWLSSGYSQIPDGPLAALAPLGGIYLCSLALAACSGLLALAAARRAVGPVGVAVGVLVVGSLAGRVEWTAPQGAPLTVALLQGNIAQDDKFEPAKIAQALQAYLAMAEASSARLIVTPESALALFRDELPAGYLDRLRAVGERNGGDVLAGLFDETAPGVFQNTMTSLGVSPPQHYRKHHLVPFGEFIPLKPLVKPVMDLVLRMPIGDQGAAPRGQPALDLAGQRVAVDICYEDAFGDEIIEPLPEASLLVNVSDDAWFGTALGPEQHLQMAQARALETGRPMARATNTGVTALIDHQGHLLSRAPKGVRFSLDGTLQGRQGSTPYVRCGNTPLVILCFALLALGHALVRRRAPFDAPVQS